MSMSLIALICILLVLSVKISAQVEFESLLANGDKRYLTYQSLVYRILDTLDSSEVSTACYKDAKRTVEGVHHKETWAMKVLDGSGDLEPGFMLGNTHWLGSKTTCDSINTPYQITLSDRFERNTVDDLLVVNTTIEFQFRMVHARHSSPWQVDMKFFDEHILHIGFCLPASCSNLEVHRMVQILFQNTTIGSRINDLDLSAQVLRVKDMKLTNAVFLKWTVIGFAIVMSLGLILATIAHFLDNVQEYELENSSILRKYLLFFSPKRNLTIIYNTEQSSKSISIIFGIKSISCFVIIAFHAIWYSFFAVSNKTQFLRFADQLQNQWVINGPLVVDVFFAISGFLMCHNFLGNSQLKDEITTSSVWENVTIFSSKVLQRYLRLLPLNIVVGLAAATIASVLNDTTLFYLQERCDINCEKFWWRDLLFIQNIFDFHDSCMSWTWYLACEFQFFTVFLAILFLHANYENTAKIIFIVLAIASCWVSLAATMKLKYVPSADVMFATETSLYANPLHRVGPYFVGVAGGWICAQQKSAASQMSKNKLSCISVVASMFVVVYMFMNQRDVDYRISSTYLVLGRWFFAASIVAIILTNMYGHQNSLTRFLSAKFFVHIGKLEYAIYLLNPLVVTVMCGFAEKSLNLDYASAYTLLFAVVIISYILALAFAVLFEVPISKVVNSLFAKNQNKKS